MATRTRVQETDVFVKYCRVAVLKTDLKNKKSLICLIRDRPDQLCGQLRHPCLCRYLYVNKKDRL